ncbi:uncharacterized protein PHACADRAFT_264142 [Phanerochaete carnosa HHB-10118-sp]|uniref:Uncharacterized protein n=1 Tax=Phanerochaete carnosa (strain HHB-10118-sp) TaxID=650164 RepID=K5VHI8_PHACS|nr:uncharacterized protein PHACADRAFT_264142 [Phanerochaete carnosa HHB-10118-sp]EKM50708.1 hypothetical protein PHACADRAFT_264142 [Phanerochaete carnosa HHB-10118-sp]
MSRLMLNLHRTATDLSRNYGATTMEFRSAVFMSHFGTMGMHANSVYEEYTAWSSRGSGGTQATSDDYEMRDM